MSHEGQDKIFEMINSKITSLLEAGTIPWKKPWSGIESIPRNISGHEYRGINLFILQMMNFPTPYFLTFKQCVEAGGKIKSGEKGNPIVFWKWVEYDNKETPDKKDQVPFLRYYTVFNLSQCELPEEFLAKFEPKPDPNAHKFVPIKEAEKLWKGYKTKPEVIDGNRAAYSPSKDQIIMPPKKHFKGNEEYYSTLFHEGVHSTGHKDRLNRKLENGFMSSDYGKEELVAELGAAYLCGICKIEPKTVENSAAYLQGWLKSIHEDKRLLVSAGGKAQAAVDHILDRKFEKKEDK